MKKLPLKDRWFTISIRVCLVVSLLLVFYVTGRAQSSLDASTPAGLTRGTPASSYALSDFDNVNVFNGHMNLHLPLLKVSGRGSASYTITMPIEQVWTSQLWDVYNNLYVPNYNWWDGIKPGYGAGVIQARHQSEGCDDSQMFSYAEGTTRLTFTLPDGTEYELIDQSFGGQPTNSFCDLSNYNPMVGISRGTTWVTRDGSAATFVSDVAIRDVLFATSGPYVTYPSGYLKLADGTVYRIDSGRVQWFRDRNGNRISFEYDTYGTRLIAVTDSLNRRVTFEYEVQDPQYGLCDRINFKGFGGASRTIRVLYKDLANALDTGQSTKTYGGANGLFPELSGSSTTTHNPRVTGGVVLPDGRSYQFFYNSYGEVTRVVLPTGGAFTYVWGAGDPNGPASGVATMAQIYRRVLEKRSYSDNGVTLTGLTTFGRYDNIYGTEGSAIVQQKSIDGNATVISQTKHYFNSGPLTYIYQGGMWLPDQMDGKEKKTERFNQAGTTVLERSTNTWTYGGSVAGTSINPHITETVRTIEPSAANLVSKQTFTFDSYNNQTDLYEYGFGAGTPGALVRQTHTDYLTTNPVNGQNYATNLNIHVRTLVKEQKVLQGTTLRSRTTYEYDNYATDTNHAGLVNRASISGLDAAYTTTYTTRGNPTATTRSLVDSSGTETGSIATYEEYDIAGNTVKGIDGRGNATSFDFADRFGAPDANAQANSGATELGSQVSYAFATKVTNALTHIGYTQFDYYLGKPVNTEDANGFVASFKYEDLLDRPTQITRAVGAAGATQTTYNYDDVARIITTSSDRDNLNDNLIVSKTLYDGLGRTTEDRQYEGGSNYITTQVQYDALGRAYKTSNPFRPWQGESAVWTTQQFDSLGRIISETTPDNAVVTTSYSGNAVTLTDEAGKKRMSVTDALGRLTDVYEDPNGLNYQTTYVYDTLDNLVKVTQGSQQRFFMYDSLKRLIRSRNPEQGTLASLNITDPLTGNSAWSMGYQYDNSDNLTSRTDARGTVTTNVYDALNRVTTILYRVNGQPDPNTGDVEYLYDNATNGKGRLWLTYKWGAKPSHTAVGQYDSLGRVTQLYNLFGDGQGGWSAGYAINRTYNLAGAVTSQSYPSGRTVSYSYDAAGRASSFTGNLGDGGSRTYASNVTYSSFGSLAREQFGTSTPLYHKSFYNIRGQFFDTRLSSVNDTWDWNRGRLIYYYSSNHVWGQSGTDNNGNVRFAEMWIPPANATLDQADTLTEDSYNYDALNRLNSVAEQRMSVAGGWGVWQQQFRQQYAYDRWGNRTIDGAQTWGTGVNNKQFTINTATNQLGVPVGQSGTMTYDTAGNLTTDTYTGAGNRVYDAENRIVSAQDTLSGWTYYTYNANAQRVRRNINNQETWQIYGIEGELVAEYAANAAVGTPQKEYGYRNGELLVTAEPVAVSNVSWTNAVGVSVNGNSLTKTAGTGWGNAGASSTQSIVSGDGYVEVTATETTTARLFGFSHTDADQSWPSIDFGIDLDLSGSAYVFESGNNRGNFGPYTAGDKFQVAIVGGVVKYKKNGVIFYASSVAPTYPLVVDTALHGNGCTLSNVVLSRPLVQWLVADQLGTPRMLVDQSGSLAALKRHDYLPFGEELFAPAGARDAAHGYTTGDNVRQQFTAKERDFETGMDYFLARYYSPVQGRFTSPDEFKGGPEELFEEVDPHDPFFYADTSEPQSLNKYHYALNNPLRYVDPDGHQTSTADKIKRGVADFITGVGRGITSSLTYGASGAPQADDTLTNRAGQSVGTMLTAAAGYTAFNAGGGATILSAGSAAEVSIPVAVVGVVTVAGATVNAVRIATTPMQRNRSGGGDPGNNPASRQNTGNNSQQGGQTSAGRPTDQHGRPLGPSGKPMIHQKNFPSTKAAKDAARNAGQGAPMKHPSPTRGTGHFHPVDNAGRKVRDGTHYNYPKP